MRTCAVPECGKAVGAYGGRLGLCHGHRARMRRRGDVQAHKPLHVKHSSRTVEAHIRQALSAGNYGEECWEWPFTRDPNGYARGYLTDGRNVPVHRYVLELQGRGPADGEVARHLCGNGHLGCWNPNHLAAGTHADNAADKLTHGTYGHKLSTEDVLDIRQRYANGEPRDSIAADYDVHVTHVNVIVSGQVWGIVEGRPSPTNIINPDDYPPPTGSQANPATFALVAAAHRTGERKGLIFDSEADAELARTRLTVARNLARRRRAAGKPLSEFHCMAADITIRRRGAGVFVGGAS